MPGNEIVAPVAPQGPEKRSNGVKNGNNGKTSEYLLKPVKSRVPGKNRRKKFNPKMPISFINPKIDIDKAIEMRVMGATIQQIADRFNCAGSSVSEVLHRYMPGDIHIGAYRNHRLDIYANLEARLLQSLSDSDIKKKMSPAQRVMGAGILYDKQRIEQGQPSAIVGAVNLTPEVIEALGKMRSQETEKAVSAAFESEAGEDDEDY